MLLPLNIFHLLHTRALQGRHSCPICLQSACLYLFGIGYGTQFHRSYLWRAHTFLAFFEFFAISILQVLFRILFSFGKCHYKTSMPMRFADGRINGLSEGKNHFLLLQLQYFSTYVISPLNAAPREAAIRLEENVTQMSRAS